MFKKNKKVKIKAQMEILKIRKIIQIHINLILKQAQKD